MNDKEQYKTYLMLKLQQQISAGNSPSEGSVVSEDSQDKTIVKEATQLRENYRQILDDIAQNAHILYGSRTKDGMASLVVEDIATFIDRARQYIELHNPYRSEQELLTRCTAFDNETFAAHWESLYPYLQKRYVMKELNLSFYIDEFPVVGMEEYTYLRMEFLSDWESALLRKEIAYELEILGRARKQIERHIAERVKIFYGCNYSSVELGLFWGIQPGMWQRKTFNLLQMLSAVCKRNPTIQILLDALGRGDGRQQERQTQLEEQSSSRAMKFSHASRSDIDGIGESNRLDALLPTEIALLGDASLEQTFYKKYVERRLQTFDFRSQTPVKVQAEQLETTSLGPGPYIVCLDTSGSMSGIPEEVAKAICYGLVLRSRAEERACYLISYSIDIEVLNLSDWEQQQEQIVNFLSYSFHGGTDLEPALKEALRMLQCDEYSLADVLVISDFEVWDLSLETITAINGVRERNTLFHSLEFGWGGNNEVLAQFDVCWYYDHHTNRIRQRKLGNRRIHFEKE